MAQPAQVLTCPALAICCAQGLFVTQNHTEARQYFEKAAEKGMAAGWNGVGVLHWSGQGTTQNFTAAYEGERWCLRSRNQTCQACGATE